MCGIAGIFNLNGEPVSPVILRKMTDTIAHRGPDGEGFYTDNFVGLGHRRLSIIDLSPAGHQPMITPDGQFVLTYNGEVYNFQDLRAELQSLGHQFRSRTDSEVVLHAFAEWGFNCVNRFNGMFAFAIWDKSRQELFLARDRYGIKPLYYTQIGHTFLFSSEIKALTAHPDFSVTVDKPALLEYFTFQNLFTDRTLFDGVRLLPSGSYLRIPLRSSQPKPICKYWDYNFTEPDKARDEREYIEELDRLLRQAVNRQLVADVEIGAYLSGGMDSGTITALAAHQIPNLKNFTCGFDLSSASGLELGFDERFKAESMSARFKTELYEMVLKAGDMERVMPRLAWHIEEPRVGQSYPNFYIAQLASKFVKVVLCGTGGDEIFGGYPWRYYRNVGNTNFEDYIEKYYKYWQRLVDNRTLRQLFAPIKAEVEHVWTQDIFRDVFHNHEHKLEIPEDYINHSLCFEARTFLHGLLTIEDKLSMAHGIETRVPFLDNDLVDFAMRLPVRMKLANLSEVVRINENEPGDKQLDFFQKTKDGKLILRKVMQRYIPSDISNGIKQGFSAPDASWFKGESIEYVKNILFNPKAAIYDYLDSKTVKSLVKEHLDGKANRRLLIWSFLSFEWWLKKYLNN